MRNKKILPTSIFYNKYTNQIVEISLHSKDFTSIRTTLSPRKKLIPGDFHIIHFALLGSKHILLEAEWRNYEI